MSEPRPTTRDARGPAPRFPAECSMGNRCQDCRALLPDASTAPLCRACAEATCAREERARCLQAARLGVTRALAPVMRADALTFTTEVHDADDRPHTVRATYHPGAPLLERLELWSGDIERLDEETVDRARVALLDRVEAHYERSIA